MSWGRNRRRGERFDCEDGHGVTHWGDTDVKRKKKQSGRMILHIHLLPSSRLLGWDDRLLRELLSPVLRLILYSFLLSISTFSLSLFRVWCTESPPPISPPPHPQLHHPRTPLLPIMRTCCRLHALLIECLHAALFFPLYFSFFFYCSLRSHTGSWMRR